jgi:DNA repair protein RadD
MIELPSLYPHQESIRDRTRSSLASLQRVILCAPPGVGKTRISKWILGASANRERLPNQSGKSLFAVHRRGLVDNASNSFLEEPELPHGLIMSDRETAYGHRIQVASIDTLLSWFIENDKYETNVTFDLIVFDEAHSHHTKLARFLQYHDSYREELGLHPAYVIGLTATPQAKGLADVYREIILGPSTQWLIDNNFLSPFRYFRATQGKLGLLIKRGDEFTNESQSLAMEGLAGDMVRDWKKHAEGRPTVGFFPRRSHAQEAMVEFERAGLRVGYVDGDTPDDKRRKMFRQLNDHEIDYLCNVQVIERGTDIPRIGCVQLCVAIGSVVRFRQMIGRGSRCHPDKTDCIILDHGANIKRHGFFEDDPQWSLDITSKDPGEVGTRPTIECPKCSVIYRGGKCQCGYEPTRQERKSQGLEWVDAELVEIKPQEKTAKAVKSAEELMVAALFRAGRSLRGCTYKQAVGIYYRMCEEQGTRHRVPKSVTIAGKQYSMLPFGHPDGGRRVSALFPITVGNGHGGDFLVKVTESAGTPY